MIHPLLTVLALLLVPSSAEPPPVAVFKELDGTWSGVFVGYDASGIEQYRIRVRQVYETVDENTQRVTITDKMPDGTVITGTGANTAHRNADGTLRLRCVVNKSNGERVTHNGRLVTGPGGDEQLVWYSKAPGRTETFRASVRYEEGGLVYEINGMGRYGEALYLMHGRYRRAEATGEKSKSQKVETSK